MTDGARLDALEHDLISFFDKLVSGDRHRSRLLTDLAQVTENGPFLAKLVSHLRARVLAAALDELEEFVLVDDGGYCRLSSEEHDLLAAAVLAGELAPSPGAAAYLDGWRVGREQERLNRRLLQGHIRASAAKSR